MYDFNNVNIYGFVKTAFDKNNIEIPFPQMDVNIQKKSIDSDF